MLAQVLTKGSLVCLEKRWVPEDREDLGGRRYILEPRQSALPETWKGQRQPGKESEYVW